MTLEMEDLRSRPRYTLSSLPLLPPLQVMTLNSLQLYKEAAHILESLQQMTEAAEMYERAGQFERAASIYIQVLMNPVMDI